MSAVPLAAGTSSASRLDIDLRGARLPGVDLSDSDFSDAKLARIVLSAADLRGTDLSRADLTGADLRGADLRDASLSGACLADADLGRVDARGAVFEAAEFRGARLDQANLRGADLSSARHLAGQAIAEAFIDSRPRLSEETAEGLRTWVEAHRGLNTDENWLRDYLGAHLGELAEAFLVSDKVKQ